MYLLGIYGYYTDNPPQFHMAQPNGIGKLGDSWRDQKVGRKAKQNSYHVIIKSKKTSIVTWQNMQNRITNIQLCH